MKLELVDAHSHIYAPEFDDDFAQVIDRAQQAGVRAILAVSETLGDAHKIVELAERFPVVKPCAGLHPCKVSECVGDVPAMLAFIRSHADRLVAVGEVGLDFSPWVVKTEEDRTVQKQVLREHVAVAREVDLALNVHSRSAGHHAITLLKDAGASKVLLHAFDGRPAAATAGVDAGFFFSIPPSIIRSPQKQKLVERVPLERLVLESDSPALGPDKAARNEPANIVRALEMIAAIKGVPAERVAEITTANARTLFPRAFL